MKSLKRFESVEEATQAAAGFAGVSPEDIKEAPGVYVEGLGAGLPQRGFTFKVQKGKKTGTAINFVVAPYRGDGFFLWIPQY